MKKIFLGLSAFTMLFATSCVKDLADPQSDGESTVVTFNVGTPEIATRAYSDGMTATVLQYAVYDAEGKILNDLTKVDETINGSTTVKLQLTTGDTYSVIFWAEAPDAPYAVNFAEKTMTVDYSAAVSNDEARDAFYAYKEFTVTGAQTETIELKRPFAQLNIGTADYAASTSAGYTPTQSAVTVKNIFKTLDLVEGEVSEPVEVAFAAADIKKDETFPVAGNEYLAMNYLLVDSEKEVVDVEFTYTDGNDAKTRTVGSVPVQRNYRTNIYGNLLTSEVDIKVEIVPEYEESDNLVYVWDGSEISKPNVSKDDSNIYEINYASELAWLAAAVNGTLPTDTKSTLSPDSFAGKTFRLTQNVDLGGKEWTPIGNSTYPFKGTFDGNDKTVKNLLITGNNSNVGLFGMTTDGEIKNVTIENAKVSGRLNVGVVAGTPYTSKYTDITVKGHVEVNGMAYVGGVGGKNAYADWTDITVDVDETSYVNANSVENGNAYRTYVGGVVGFNGEGGHAFKNITSNIDVKGSTIDVGGLFGIAHYGNKFENCSCTGDVEIYDAEESAEAEEIGGIAGVWNNGGADVVMTKCAFDGNIKTNIERTTVWYNNLVGKPYSVDGSGRLIIDNVVVVASANTLQAAIDKAVEGETITFVADVKSTDGVVITDKKITIDLNDKTFTVSEGANTNNRNFKINGSSVVTIKNGTMVADGDYSSGAYGTIRTEGTANVTLSNVTLYNYRGNGLNIKACSGTTVTITDSKVYSEYGGGIEAAGGTIELNGVSVEQKGMYTAPYNSMAISVNGGGKVTVNSGTYSTACITAEEANNQGTSHGPWCAGVLNSGGTLIIKGGTFSNDNFGENTLAIYARGLLLADTGANIQINGGTFNAVKAIVDVTNNLGDATRNPSVTLAGGEFSADPRVSGLYASELISVKEDYRVVEKEGNYVVEFFVPTAKVGNTEYGSIDEAIANWTNNSTLTLLADVTLSDVITLKSTEHHILDLGTYTMTAAEGKNAIEITCNGRSNASYALTVNADATNPGGITATGKACIYYKKSDSTKDRPIILINNGVFTGSYSINSTSNGNTNCTQVWINGGVFNSYMNLTKNMLKISGGTFHAAINCTGDQNAYRLISGGRFKKWQFMTADAPNKFAVSSTMSKDKSGNWIGTYDVGCYVDSEGYLVVGGPVITEAPGSNYEKKSYSSWSTYLKYSSAATYGLYYEK